MKKILFTLIFFVLFSTTNNTLTWNNPVKLTPTNPIGKPNFGTVITFSSDSNYFAVGGFNDNNKKGAVWVYQKNSVTWNWNNPIKLTPTNPLGKSFFGNVITFSNDNNYLAVGGQYDNFTEKSTEGIGAVWIYQKNFDSWDWFNPKKLIPTNPIKNPQFGNVIAFSNDNKNLVIGGYYDNSDKGAAWVYSNNGTNWDWNNPIKLVPKDSLGAPPKFGYSLAFSRDSKNLAVNGYDDNEKGAVWVYSKNSTNFWNWENSVKLIPTNPIGNSQFGRVIAFSKDNKNLAVGGYWDDFSKGAVWVYNKNSSEIWDWNNPVKLIPTNPFGSAIWFGQMLTFSDDNNYLAVNGYRDNRDTGAIWVYQKNSETWDWNNPIKLTPLAGFKNINHFGRSFAFSNDTNNLATNSAHVITPYNCDVWIYQRNLNTWDWNNPTKLTLINQLEDEVYIGAIVFSNDNNNLAIAYAEDNTDLGAVWIYDTLSPETSISPTSSPLSTFEWVSIWLSVALVVLSAPLTYLAVKKCVDQGMCRKKKQQQPLLVNGDL